jgi:hypothetical protein
MRLALSQVQKGVVWRPSCRLAGPTIPDGALVMSTIMIACVSRSMDKTRVFDCVCLCVCVCRHLWVQNNAVGAEQRGALSGFASAVSGVGQTLAPLVTAPLFAWSLTNGRSFPLNV